jgi:hypothetical protein
VRIDHVIYAAADLDEAAARIERELGLAVHGGGRHEGLGTHNRIVPLGGGYLELLASPTRTRQPDRTSGARCWRATATACAAGRSPSTTSSLSRGGSARRSPRSGARG